MKEKSWSFCPPLPFAPLHSKAFSPLPLLLCDPFFLPWRHAFFRLTHCFLQTWKNFSWQNWFFFSGKKLPGTRRYAWKMLISILLGVSVSRGKRSFFSQKCRIAGSTSEVCFVLERIFFLEVAALLLEKSDCHEKYRWQLKQLVSHDLFSFFIRE